MKRVIVATLALLVFASPAAADHGTQWPFDKFKDRRLFLRDAANDLRAERCLPPLHFRYLSREVRLHRRDDNIRLWVYRVYRSEAKPSSCETT